MLTKFLYRSYSRFYAFRRWRKRHVTPVGLMVITAFFLSGILGFNILKSTLYQVMSFCLAALAVSAGLQFPFKLRIRVNRILPEYATVNDKMTYEIEISNESSKTQKGLILYENIQDPRPDLQTLLSREEPFAHLRNAWDRKTLYFRWLWLIQRAQKAQFRPIDLPDLPANDTVRVTVTIRPHYRGTLHFSGLSFARPDVIGLFARLFHIKKTQKLWVLPKRYPLQTPDLMSARQYHPGGVSLASSIGNSDEFMSLRYYRPGDPIRNIHWKTFAKTNELVIKEFEDEYFVRHALILDTFLTTQNDTIFEEAVSIASSYISSIQMQDAILDLMFVGNQTYSFSSGRGLGHSDKMLEILACVDACTDKTISALVPLLQSNIKKISGAICIFLDWDAGHTKIYQMFKQFRVPVFMIVLAEDSLKMEEKISRQMDTRAHIQVVPMDKIQQALGTP